VVIHAYIGMNNTSSIELAGNGLKAGGGRRVGQGDANGWD
jgi:hypothetical protein